VCQMYIADNHIHTFPLYFLSLVGGNFNLAIGKSVNYQQHSVVEFAMAKKVLDSMLTSNQET